MPNTFNVTKVTSLISAVSSNARRIGNVEQVLTHEPKSKPVKNITMAMWIEGVKPLGKVSGLSSVAGLVTLNARIYISFLYKPEDTIEAKLLVAASDFMNQMTGDFTLGESVIAVDLLGAYSQGMQMKTGYVTIDNAVFRIADVTVPIVINDLWAMVP